MLEHGKDRNSWDNLMATVVRLSATSKEQIHRNFFDTTNAASGLPAIVTWAGGKTRELKRILSNIPSYDRFFEPFVGGGSVFMGINAGEYFINDFSSSLISLYKNIASGDEKFHHYLEAMDMSIVKAGVFAKRYQEVLADIYGQIRTDILSRDEMKKSVSDWCEINKKEILDIIGEFSAFSCNLIHHLKNYICGRFIRRKKGNCTDISWIYKHIEAAVKGAVYNTFRDLFNNKDIREYDAQLHSALMVYIHQYTYSGMSKYDKKGNFNNSYGGIGVMEKRLDWNLKYYKSEKVREHFRHTHIYNYDFEEFLHMTKPTENDFIFLDPPYDCVFSSYDNNEFNKSAHQRLANYLFTKCKAKWMMVISKTDFIYGLYNRPGIYIKEYDKTYSCNAKNNFDREVTHLMITNYPLEENMTVPDVEYKEAA